MFARLIRHAIGKKLRKIKANAVVLVKKRLFATVNSANSAKYGIYPSVGVARLGNAINQDKNSGDWYIEPPKIGGLPLSASDGTTEVRKFKNKDGLVKRQAAKFTIYNLQTGQPLKMSDLESVKWTAWVANKKAVFYDFAELNGDVMLGRENSYKNRAEEKVDGEPIVIQRNVDEKELQKFIINPGPRSVDKSTPNAQFDKNPDDPHSSFPLDALHANNIFGMDPFTITTLGDMNMNINDAECASLYVRGGYGLSGGDPEVAIGSFAGAGKWFDDTSDGPVEVEFKVKGDDETYKLNAYVICASPKFAPELVNISTWDDVVFDIGVRYHKDFASSCVDYSDPLKFKWKLGAGGYKVNVDNDIVPILDRMKHYMWVANIAPMTQFATPKFDLYATDQDTIAKRRVWFKLLREAIPLINNDQINDDVVTNKAHQLCFAGDEWPNEEDGNTFISDPYSYPYMPLNAGSGSVQPGPADGPMSKFLTLTPTQYYMVYQWVEGHITTADTTDQFNISNVTLNELTRASLGNCVGYPASPGIEVTWNVRNPWMYEKDDVFKIKSVAISDLQSQDPPLSQLRDECDPLTHPLGPFGLEPGDLSKRMAIPWHADFAYCSVQPINFSDPTKNQDKEDPSSSYPQYFTYWWPPQAPWNVYASNFTSQEQQDDVYGDGFSSAVATGQNVFYQRGVLTQHPQVSIVPHWHELGFILNENQDEDTKKDYPNYVEVERNNKFWLDNISTFAKEKLELEGYIREGRLGSPGAADSKGPDISELLAINPQNRIRESGTIIARRNNERRRQRRLSKQEQSGGGSGGK